MAVQTKTSRIDIRLMPQDKSAIETAASLKRVSVSAYILSAAIEAARMDIEKEETLVLADQVKISPKLFHFYLLSSLRILKKICCFVTVIALANKSQRSILIHRPFWFLRPRGLFAFKGKRIFDHLLKE